MIIKRLGELTKVELLALGVFMREEIKPESISEGCTWVCLRLQKAHYWGDKRIAEFAKWEGPDSTLQAWVAFEGKTPVGFCMLAVEPDALQLKSFLIEASRTEKEQFAVADELALRSLGELPERNKIYSWFPGGFAARYAERCGFESIVEGKPMAPDPDPLMRWWMNPAELKKNIEVLQWQQP